MFIRILQSEQVEETIRSAVSQLKKIDILVNGKIVSCDHGSCDTHYIAAAGNFLSPAASLSPKGFRTGNVIKHLVIYLAPPLCSNGYRCHRNIHGVQSCVRSMDEGD